MSEYAIEVNNVSKKFKIYFDKGYSLRDKLLFWKRNRYEELKVLQNVSFSIKKGEAVGLIGHNGCGKSTTLKMLTRIMYPDAGEIIMNGRVSSLLELGAGFHPDMSGIENIYITAACPISAAKIGLLVYSPEEEAPYLIFSTRQI